MTIELEELDDLRGKILHKEKELSDLRKQLDESLYASSQGDLIKALEAATEAALFGVGNLPPHEIRGWPSEALRTLGGLFIKLKFLPDKLRDMGPDLILRANEADEVELIRKRRDDAKKLLLQLDEKTQ